MVGGGQGGTGTRTMWLKSLNFLQGVYLSRLFKRCCSTWGSRKRSEGHIHGTYVVISDWEREREGDEKRCRISICCANRTKLHTWVTPFDQGGRFSQQDIIWLRFTENGMLFLLVVYFHVITLKRGFQNTVRSDI